MARDLRIRLKKEELHHLYLQEKKSLEDIARLYGVSRVAVWKYCRAAGTTRRSRSEARLEAQKKGKVPQSYFDINESFFSEWFPGMAYVLGLIITDGCISKSGTVSLCINDRDLLEKVKMTMDSGHPVRQSRHQKGLYSLIFAREELVADLNNIGVFPKKSHNVRFPDVPEAHLVDFIRGVFDGDGSVFFEKRSSRCPLRSKFMSGSRHFIETLENKLRILGMPERNIYEQKTKNGILYMFRYSHRDSSDLFRILYKDALESGLFLRRKYYKFLSGLRSGS